MNLPNKNKLADMLIQFYKAPNVKHICNGLPLYECYDFELSKIINTYTKSALILNLTSNSRIQRISKWFYILYILKQLQN